MIKFMLFTMALTPLIIHQFSQINRSSGAKYIISYLGTFYMKRTPGIFFEGTYSLYAEKGRG